MSLCAYVHVDHYLLFVPGLLKVRPTKHDIGGLDIDSNSQRSLYVVSNTAVFLIRDDKITSWQGE